MYNKLPKHLKLEENLSKFTKDITSIFTAACLYEVDDFDEQMINWAQFRLSYHCKLNVGLFKSYNRLIFNVSFI